MNVIDLLLSSNPVIERLTKVHLLNQKVPFTEEGYIKHYLDLFDPIKKTWEGIYSPKWVSTHYTLLELTYMELNPKHPIYQEALSSLLKHEWNPELPFGSNHNADMCIMGMLLNMASYGSSKDPKVYEIVDYILDHTMPDGGWNCNWHKRPIPKISSVHTTTSILEGLYRYQKAGYTYRLHDVKISMLSGIEMLLKRNLYQAHGTKETIHEAMIHPSYPPRWKFDILRILELLTDMKYPDDLRMTDAINLLISQMKGPLMLKGAAIPGKLHFKLEEGRYGMFNTLRVLKVLKHYRYPLYERLIKAEI